MKSPIQNPESTVINALIVDDSSFMQKSLTHILESDKSIKVIGIASDGVEAIQNVKRLKPDVVLLDKAVLDTIGEPLIHLLRNAVDHGIESEEVRKKRKKKESGTIKLAAQRAENNILIYVEDDGAGIDIARMKKLAVEKGFAKAEEIELAEEKDVLDFLFEPAFSSADIVSGISGRGVGLDVVKTSVEALGGTVRISTQKGEGTRFTLELPLTTALMHTLMVGDISGNMFFIVPSEKMKRFMNLVASAVPGGTEGDKESKSDPSIIMEIGNILAGVYLTSINEFCKLKIYHSAPKMAIDMIQALMDETIVGMSRQLKTIILIENEFIIEEERIKGSVALIGSICL